MQNTLEYTAYNGMKFYIVYIKALEKEPEEDSPMMSIVFTTHPEIVAEAKAYAECNDDAVPVGCKTFWLIAWIALLVSWIILLMQLKRVIRGMSA